MVHIRTFLLPLPFDLHLPVDFQGLLEVMASAGQAGGPSAEVSTLLVVCIRDSLESAFRWHIEQTAKDADNDAVRICLLAKASVNLLGVEVTTFSPVLAPYLPIAADVAAKALHELFGSQLLPWLATGVALSHCCDTALGLHSSWCHKSTHMMLDLGLMLLPRQLAQYLCIM